MAIEIEVKLIMKWERNYDNIYEQITLKKNKD